MAKGAAQEGAQAVESAQSGDIPSAVEHGTGALLNAGMVADTVHGLAKEAPSTARDLATAARTVADSRPVGAITPNAVGSRILPDFLRTPEQSRMKVARVAEKQASNLSSALEMGGQPAQGTTTHEDVSTPIMDAVRTEAARQGLTGREFSDRNGYKAGKKLFNGLRSEYDGAYQALVDPIRNEPASAAARTASNDVVSKMLDDAKVMDDLKGSNSNVQELLNLRQVIRNAKTIGDLDNLRQTLNRLSSKYLSRNEAQQYTSPITQEALNESANSIRNVLYDEMARRLPGVGDNGASLSPDAIRQLQQTHGAVIEADQMMKKTARGISSVASKEKAPPSALNFLSRIGYRATMGSPAHATAGVIEKLFSGSDVGLFNKRMRRALQGVKADQNARHNFPETTLSRGDYVRNPRGPQPATGVPFAREAAPEPNLQLLPGDLQNLLPGQQSYDLSPDNPARILQPVKHGPQLALPPARIQVRSGEPIAPKTNSVESVGVPEPNVVSPDGEVAQPTPPGLENKLAERGMGSYNDASAKRTIEQAGGKYLGSGSGLAYFNIDDHSTTLAVPDNAPVEVVQKAIQEAARRRPVAQPETGRRVSWDEENPQIGDTRQRTNSSAVETLREFDVNDPRLVHEMDLPKRLGPEYTEHYDKDKAEQYSKLPADTALPIDLTDTGKELLISDGWHRWEAAKLRGDKTIKAWVKGDKSPIGQNSVPKENRASTRIAKSASTGSEAQQVANKEPWPWKYEDYKPFQQQLAKNYTRAELEKKLSKLEGEQSKNTASHLRAIDRTTSMTSNSQARAQTGNVVRGNWEQSNDLRNALEIHDHFPQQAKGASPSTQESTSFTKPEQAPKVNTPTSSPLVPGLPSVNQETVRGEIATKQKRTAKLQTGDSVSGNYGSPVSVKTPTGQLPGKYKVVEADSLIPSHNAGTFAKNPQYPEGVQERAYHTSKEAQARVIDQAQNYDTAYTINTNPDAVNGPPVVTPDGIVLGGNSRAMSTQRVYSSGKGDNYRNQLKSNAQQFGVDPAVIDGMKRPVLVREIAAPQTVEEARRIGSELNKSMTGALGVSEKAVTAGRSLKPETLQSVSAMLREGGADSSLRDILRDRGKDIITLLQKDGVITDRERPQFVDTATGGLSEEGKSFAERALLGSVVDDPVLMDRTPKSVLNKISSSLGDISEVSGRADEYNILPLIREALSEHADIAQRGTTIDLHLGQAGMFGPERNPAVDAIVRKLGDKPSAVRDALGVFAQDARADTQGQGFLMMGEKPTPTAAFNNAFGTNFTESEYIDAMLGVLKKIASTGQNVGTIGGRSGTETTTPTASQSLRDNSGQQASGSTPQSTRKPAEDKVSSVLPSFLPKVSKTTAANFDSHISDAKTYGYDVKFINKQPKGYYAKHFQKTKTIEVYTKGRTPEQIASSLDHEIGHIVDYDRRGIISDPMGDSIKNEYTGEMQSMDDGHTYFRMGPKVKEAQAIRTEVPRKDGAANTQKEIYADAYRLFKNKPERLAEIAPTISKEIVDHISKKKGGK
jgi:hypothetical protein